MTEPRNSAAYKWPVTEPVVHKILLHPASLTPNAEQYCFAEGGQMRISNAWKLV